MNENQLLNFSHLRTRFFYLKKNIDMVVTDRIYVVRDFKALHNQTARLFISCSEV